MTVHAVKIVCSTSQESNPSTEPTPSPPDWSPRLLKDRINQNVFDTLTEVLTDQSQSPIKTNTKIDGSGTTYIHATYRVDSAYGKATVLDEFEQGTVIDADWYEVRYHQCDHDESADQRTGCGDWTTERSNGTVPEDV